MQTAEDIIERVRHLDETLVWQPVGNKGENLILISSDTQRIVARIDKVGDEYCIKRRGEYEQSFRSEAGAQVYVKFKALADILSETLRNQYIQ